MYTALHSLFLQYQLIAYLTYTYACGIETPDRPPIYADYADLVRDAGVEKIDLCMWENDDTKEQSLKQQKSSITIPYLFAKARFKYSEYLPKRPFIIVPLFPLYSELSCKNQDVSKPEPVSNKLYRVNETLTENEFFSFGTEKSLEVVKSITFQGQDIFSVSKEGPEQRSACFFLENIISNMSMLYICAFIHKPTNTEDDKLSLLFDKELIYKTGKKDVTGMVFELSIYIHRLPTSICYENVDGSNSIRYWHHEDYDKISKKNSEETIRVSLIGEEGYKFRVENGEIESLTETDLSKCFEKTMISEDNENSSDSSWDLCSEFYPGLND
ncbi:hypothetical protein CDIK_3402 [Cucumispora dikerogammari]|nr:hypothetical protein CDIK_3402 [Cucumispora dikerogammari]